jgi:hypothetical protein
MLDTDQRFSEGVAATCPGSVRPTVGKGVAPAMPCLPRVPHANITKGIQQDPFFAGEVMLSEAPLQ